MSNGNTTTWTDERDQALREAWTKTTATAPEIAKAIGGFDHTADGGKNAVIGRARRLGLTRKDKDKDKATTDTQRAERVKAKERQHSKKSYDKKRGMEPVFATKPPAPKVEPVAGGWTFDVLFSDLRELSTHQPNQCRYLDPKDDVGPNYLCCGAETLPGESYCGHCAEICRPSRTAPITEERREQLRVSGRAAGYASIRSRGRVMGRSVAMATSPVLDSEVRV